MKPIESSSSDDDEDDDEDDEEETTEEMEVTPKKKNNESPASNLRPTTKQLTVTSKTNSLNKQQKKDQRKAIRKANRPQGQVKRLTQEELLEEAKITEQKNIASLEILLKKQKRIRRKIEK